MDFRTELPIRKSAFQISYPDTLLALGSCFAEHIGQYLSDRKLDIRLNPFGILYNPMSLLQALRFLRTEDTIAADSLFQHQDLWHHFGFHSRYSHPDREQALQLMNDSLQRTRTQLLRTNRLLITWGTAYAYRRREDDKVVANCHKLPGTAFERFRLETDQFLDGYRDLLLQWKAEQPTLQVLLSVSPVRHLRDGLIANQRSKAVLLLAAEALTRSLDFIHYFPAYELVLDDLRDYRFYQDDLTHPNPKAVEYVWNYFRHACFSPEAAEVADALQALLQAVRHRPFHTDTPAYRRFCQDQLRRIERLRASYAFLDLSAEQQYFERRVNSE